MASKRTIRVEGLAGVAVEIIGVALSHIKGIPGLVWTLVLIFGGCLLLVAVVQWFLGGGRMSDKDEGGGPGQSGGGQVNAEKIEQGPNGQVIGQQINNPPAASQPQSVVTNAPVGILFGPGAQSNHSVWNVTFGEADTPTPPTMPPQISASEEEKGEIRKELLDAAASIQTLTGIWRLTPHQAEEQSGLSDKTEAEAWRNKYDEGITQRYIAEVYPSVINAYQRARVRGFFDPEIEKILSLIHI